MWKKISRNHGEKVIVSKQNQLETNSEKKTMPFLSSCLEINLKIKSMSDRYFLAVLFSHELL